MARLVPLADFVALDYAKLYSPTRCNYAIGGDFTEVELCDKPATPRPGVTEAPVCDYHFAQGEAGNFDAGPAPDEEDVA